MKELLPDENPTVLAILILGFISAIGFVAMWLWNHTMGRIRALETGKVDKEIFEDYAAQAEVSRQDIRNSQEQGRRETRETFIKVFEKLDDIKDDIRDIPKK